jgi:Family of unknown function (DUF5362)
MIGNDVKDEGCGEVSSAAVEALRGTKGWVKFVGILLFVCACLTLLAVVVMLGAAVVGTSAKTGLTFATALMMSLVYGIFGALYAFLGLYLMRFSGAIGRLIADRHPSQLEEALESQRKFWRLAGIVAMVMVALMILGILAAILLPLIAGR